MADQRMYHAPGLDLPALGEALSQWFMGEGFEAQTLQAPGGLAIQARRTEGWRSWVGMSAALNVTLMQQGDQLTVQMGAAKWTDKAVVGAVGLLIFWPALIPAGYGAWKQKKLPDQVFQFIDQYVAGGGAVSGTISASAVPAPTTTLSAAALTCPSCGEAVRPDAKFCDSCGATLRRDCSECGQPLRPGAKFCDSCGAAAEATAK